MTPSDPSPPAAAVARRQALEAVATAARSGDLVAARRLALLALDDGLEHPMLLNLRALDHEDAGRFDAALTDLRRAHVLAPQDPGILNACGLCLGRLERPDEAIKCFDQVVTMAPAFGPAWFNRGWSLERLGRTAEAAESYAKCVALDPQNAQAWANMALLAVKRGDPTAARDHAERALALQPGHVTAVLALAEAELPEPEAAERRLRDLLAETLGPYDRALAQGLLADALDAQGRTAEAFAAYSDSNDLFRAESGARFEGAGQRTVADTVAWLLRWAERLDARRWTAAPQSDPGEAASHVFLMGFPRSGTTLAETVLRNHPDVVSLEERDTLYAGVVDFLTDSMALKALGTIPDRDLRRYREDYWARVRRFGVEPGGKIFLDKNPFNALKLPLIYKLFPHARIVFSVRDPRDVVLSCFRRRFILNPSTYELLDLRRAADYYAGSMRLAEILRSKQPMAEHLLVYERLVADLPGEARAVCDFIGAEWRDDLLDIAARARRGEVASASSAQIARGLFSDGAGQWRRYRPQLEPVLPILEPWIARFGYPAE